MSHAFLLIVHNNWEQLKLLLKQLDNVNNDIYIHIDAKVKDVPVDSLMSCVNESNIEILSKYKVYWGSFELVQVELYLLKEATKKNYDYYHLLSGNDLMIKSMETFFEFFKKNRGKEFIHFSTEKRLIEDKEILRRVKSYHLFTNFRRRFKHKILNKIFDTLEHISLGIQEILKVDRTKKYNFSIKYGSQWFSITNDFAKYLISKEKIIYKIFNKTKCADELFVQTILFNSNFEKKLFNRNYDASCESNMRLIDIEKRGFNGSPYVWKLSDFEELKNSKCLFARKFDLKQDSKIIDKVIKITRKV